MTHTYSRGHVIFATPTEVNDNDIPITTTKDGKIGKHPIIVLSADAKSITGVMLQTFNTGTSLSGTGLDAALYKWFLPISPATKESIHDPIPAQPGSSGKAQWVNLKDVMTILEKDIKKKLGEVSPSTLTTIELAISVVNEENSSENV